MSNPTTRYDRYGRSAGYISPLNNQVDAYLTFTPDKFNIFQCFFETGSDPRAIWHIQKSADGKTQRITIAWDVWVEDAATLAAYTWFPVNDYFEVDDVTGELVHPTDPAPPLDPETAETTEG